MASKPESTFIRAVHAHLLDVYCQKNNNPFRKGEADCWYSGQKDMWVEYKFVPTIPRRADLHVATSLLEPSQRKWLNERMREGRTVAVIVGCPDGGVIFAEGSWERPIAPEDFLTQIMPREAIAGWIRSQTGCSPCLTRNESSPRLPSRQRRTASSRPRSSSGSY